MPKPKRLVDATAQLTTTPPDLLPAGHVIAQVVGGAGKNLYNVQLPAKTNLLVELAPQFRNSFWLRKGGFVVVDTGALSERDNKLGGEIVNVVRDEKQWRKAKWWPTEFPKQNLLEDDSDDDSDVVGKMPPSDSEDDLDINHASA